MTTLLGIEDPYAEYYSLIAEETKNPDHVVHEWRDLSIKIGRTMPLFKQRFFSFPTASGSSQVF